MTPSMTTLKHKPLWYTDEEGGVQKDWPSDIEFIIDWFKLRSDTTVSMNRLSVHSVGWRHIRWDCVNGLN